MASFGITIKLNLLSTSKNFRWFSNIQECSNIPLEHIQDPQPTVYVSEFLSFGGDGGCLGYAPWGMAWGSLRKINIQQPWTHDKIEVAKLEVLTFVS